MIVPTSGDAAKALFWSLCLVGGLGIAAYPAATALTSKKLPPILRSSSARTFCTRFWNSFLGSFKVTILNVRFPSRPAFLRETGESSSPEGTLPSHLHSNPLTQALSATLKATRCDSSRKAHMSSGFKHGTNKCNFKSGSIFGK